jgi:hypothetical protein
LLRVEANTAGLEAGFLVLFDKRAEFADIEIGHVEVFDLEPFDDLLVSPSTSD